MTTTEPGPELSGDRAPATGPDDGGTPAAAPHQPATDSPTDTDTDTALDSGLEPVPSTASGPAPDPEPEPAPVSGPGSGPVPVAAPAAAEGDVASAGPGLPGAGAALESDAYALARAVVQPEAEGRGGGGGHDGPLPHPSHARGPAQGRRYGYAYGPEHGQRYGQEQGRASGGGGGLVEAVLRRRLVALREVVAISRTRVPGATLAGAEKVLDEAAARDRYARGHTVVALAGSTGSGKSTLFNALVGAELAAAGTERPTTCAPLACAWSERADGLLDRLGIDPADRFRPAETDDPDLAGLVLLDLPDHDSVSAGHRARVERLLGLVDVMVWVVDPEKYADAVLHERYLRPLAGYAEVLVIALNQIDRLPGDATDQVLDDLRRLLDEDGLALGEHGDPGATVLALSALTGAGVGELRETLEQFTAERVAADRRLTADLDAATLQLRPVFLTDGPTGLSARACEDFEDRLADAAGAVALGQAAERAWLRAATHACSTPWSRLASRTPWAQQPDQPRRPRPSQELHESHESQEPGESPEAREASRTGAEVGGGSGDGNGGGTRPADEQPARSARQGDAPAGDQPDAPYGHRSGEAGATEYAGAAERGDSAKYEGSTEYGDSAAYEGSTGRGDAAEYGAAAGRGGSAGYGSAAEYGGSAGRGVLPGPGGPLGDDRAAGAVRSAASLPAPAGPNDPPAGAAPPPRARPPRRPPPGGGRAGPG
ncbi:GTPase, partial [Streptomyces sp. HSW2009]|uniref:GTPase family protein n=1 Tax=Streptomyces sp. HSW2009 TaxID=3142890 RepID=UPI0032EFBD21